MTLLVDKHEEDNHPDLITLLRQSVDVDVSKMNQDSGNPIAWPDFVIFGTDKLVGINRKTVGEWLSNSDACISQLQRELAGPVEHLVLLIEGVMRVSGEVMVAANLDWDHQHLWMRGQGGEVPFTHRVYNINPKHAQNEQTRLEFLGVQVVHTYSIQDTASKIISFHDLVMKGEPNNVLNKLRKADIAVLGLTPQETRFARQLMSMDGVGEEAALTLAASFNNIMELIEYWQQGSSIADTMLRSGTRRIGTALEQKLQTSIGYTRVATTESTRQEAAAFSQVPDPRQTGYL